MLQLYIVYKGCILPIQSHSCLHLKVQEKQNSCEQLVCPRERVQHVCNMLKPFTWTEIKIKMLHCPGIEPGSQEWESCMIPLHQQCSRIDIGCILPIQSLWYSHSWEKVNARERLIFLDQNKYDMLISFTHIEVKKERVTMKKLHCPGIEPGSQEWESCMIPLHQQCSQHSIAEPGHTLSTRHL